MRGRVGRGRRGVRLALVVCALLGLFAMHGLADHGTHVPAGHPRAAVAADPSTDPSADGHPDGSAQQLLGLCLAVLALAAARSRRWSSLGWPAQAGPHPGPLPTSPVGARPRRRHPPPYVLQVMRC